MPALTLKELARRLDGRLDGPADGVVRRVSPLREAGPEDLSFLHNPRYTRQLGETRAAAVLVAEGLEASPPEGCTLVRVADPYLALARILEVLHPEVPPDPGVRAGAWIDPEAGCGEELAAFPGSFVGKGARLGDRVVLHAGAVVGEECRLGDDVTLHPNVVLYPGTELGHRVRVHAGSVLGSDGFGYAPGPDGIVKVPQVGRLVVEDDVEIGAGVTIDRGSLGETRIGRGTRIDNLVQIGHNVRIGSNCLIAGQAGISGSTTLGDGVVVAGQSGAAGHLMIGAGARIAAKTAVFQDLEPGVTVAGVPAVEIALWRRVATASRRLPELLRRLRALESGTRRGRVKNDREDPRE